MSVGGALAQAFVRLRVDSSAVAADTSEGIEEGAAAADVETAGAGAGERAATAFSKAFKLGMIGILAAAAVGAAAVKEAVDFQTQMTRIQTQAGATSGQVKQLSAAVLQLAPSTQQGPMQLAEALYHLKSVGMDDAQAMQALKTASDLAAVGGSNLEQTTNAIAAAWKSGIAGAQNFGQAAATVNAIVGAGNMTMSQLVASMGSGVLSAAQTFGLSLKQVGAAEALMADAGIPAQRAATDLKMSISLLGAPSVTAAEQLKTIGLSATALASAMRSGGLIGAISLLKQHIKDAGLTAVQTSQLLSRAFGGGESGASIMLMVNRLDALKQKQDQINAGVSKFGSDVAAQRQTIQAQLDILRSSLETTGIRMGQALLPPFTKLVKFLAADLLPDVLKLAGVLGRLFKNPFVDAFVAALLTAAVAIKTIITLTEIWEAVLLMAEAVSGIGLVIVAVAALAAGITILWERSSTFRNVVEGAFRAVADAAKDTWNWIKGHWMLLAAILIAPILPAVAIMAGLFLLLRKPVQEAFDAIKKIIVGGFDSWWASHGKELVEVWDAAWGMIKAGFDILFGPIVAAVKAGWNLIVGVIVPGMNLLVTVFRMGWGYVAATTRGTWDLITGICKAAWDVISGVVQIAVAGVESTIKIAWDLIVGIFDVALDLLTGQWGKAWDDIQNTVTQVWNAIKGFLGSAISDIENMFEGAWNALLGGVKSWGSDLVGYFRQVPGMILSALGDVGKMLWNAGVAIIKGLIGGIESAVGGVAHVISSVASTIKSFLPFSPAKQGPLSGSGDPFYSGLSIGKKIAAGITASLPALKSAVSGTVGTINSALSKAATEEKSGTSQLSTLTSSMDRLQALRSQEEASIKKLIAAREQEYKTEGKSSDALRKSQEDEIKELEKLRSSQETQVKQSESVIDTLKKSMTALKDQVDKLKDALTKATKAAAAAAASSSSSSSSDDSDDSDDSSSSSDQPANWAAFGQWLAETGPNPADAGSWQGEPRPARRVRPRVRPGRRARPGRRVRRRRVVHGRSGPHVRPDGGRSAQPARRRGARRAWKERRRVVRGDERCQPQRDHEGELVIRTETSGTPEAWRLAVGLTIAAMDDDPEAFKALLDGVPRPLLEGVVADLADIAIRVWLQAAETPAAARDGLAMIAMDLAAEGGES
jgi:TP901 family phage tail tape measure protein